MSFLNLIENLRRDIKDLYSKHEFKYQFFLFFYEYYSSKKEGKEAKYDKEKIYDRAKEIGDIRDMYLTGIEQCKVPMEKIIQISDDLERKIESLLNVEVTSIIDESTCTDILKEMVCNQRAEMISKLMRIYIILKIT